MIRINNVDYNYEKGQTILDVAKQNNIYIPTLCFLKGVLEEAWGTGTAAVVSPIGHLFYDNQDYTVSNNQIGELTQRLYDELTGIQWGKREDKRNWVYKVKVK